MTAPPNPPRLPEYDWESATRKLVFYFSRRGLMNAHDLAQETLTRVVSWLRDGNTIEGEDGFMKTVFGFARFVRKEGLTAQRYTTELPEPDVSSVENTTLGLNTPEAVHYLRSLLQQLPESDRTLIVAIEEGTAQSSLASEMKIPISTLRVKLHRAREKLRQLESSRPHGRRCS